MSYFSWNQKVSLARSLVSKASPAYVQFYVTARCNMSCEQCNIIYADASAQEMNLEQIKQMAENFSKIGVCMVLLIGGEPFIRKDLPQIIKAFTDIGIHVRLQTNGLASENELRDCAEAGAHDISVSLDSLNQVVQDKINGGYKNSWNKAIKTASVINRIFPEGSTGFFGTVLMPQNIDHIKDVVEFATEIGWGVSLVPAHSTSTNKPLGFRTFDENKQCAFMPEDYGRVSQVIQELKVMRKEGFNLYDSEEYLDDIVRFITKKPLQWRRRNGDVCDSPSLYFAVDPSGRLKPCCDYQLEDSFYVYEDSFVDSFKTGQVQKSAKSITSSCDGCMYGSYPEITISARYLKPFIERVKYFNTDKHKNLKKYSYEEMLNIASQIFMKNSEARVQRSSPEVINEY